MTSSMDGTHATDHAFPRDSFSELEACWRVGAIRQVYTIPMEQALDKAQVLQKLPEHAPGNVDEVQYYTNQREDIVVCVHFKKTGNEYDRNDIAAAVTEFAEERKHRGFKRPLKSISLPLSHVSSTSNSSPSSSSPTSGTSTSSL